MMTETEDKDRRQRLKRKSGALMALIVGPVILFGAAVTILEPHNYPAGDIRNEPFFWIVWGILAVIVAGALLVGSVRELSRGDTRDPPDA